MSSQEQPGAARSSQEQNEGCSFLYVFTLLGALHGILVTLSTVFGGVGDILRALRGALGSLGGARGHSGIPGAKTLETIVFLAGFRWKEHKNERVHFCML